jgi:hypothetical protein
MTIYRSQPSGKTEPNGAVFHKALFYSYLQSMAHGFITAPEPFFFIPGLAFGMYFSLFLRHQ